jgi:hypothetical protein
MIYYVSEVVLLRTWIYMTIITIRSLIQSTVSSTKVPTQSPPPSKEADDNVFNAVVTPNAPPRPVCHFVGTINLRFAVSESKKGTMNIPLLLKRVMSYAKQTDSEFRLEPLNGSGQCITNPSNIP